VLPLQQHHRQQACHCSQHKTCALCCLPVIDGGHHILGKPHQATVTAQGGHSPRQQHTQCATAICLLKLHNMEHHRMTAQQTVTPAAAHRCSCASTTHHTCYTQFKRLKPPQRYVLVCRSLPRMQVFACTLYVDRRSSARVAAIPSPLTRTWSTLRGCAGSRQGPPRSEESKVLGSNPQHGDSNRGGSGRRGRRASDGGTVRGGARRSLLQASQRRS
jgi:hypothetical protein